MAARDRFIIIDNLSDIATAYGDSAAGHVLALTVERLELLIGRDTFTVELEPWGARVGVRAAFWTRASEAALEAGVFASVRAPFDIPQGQIVIALSVVAEAPGTNERLSLVANLSAVQYRASMTAAALAYSCLATGKLHLIEQPISGAREAGNVLYYECLARLAGESGEIVLPSAYISALEELGLMRAFDRAVVEATIGQLRLRRDAVLGCNVSSSSASLDPWWTTVFSDLIRRDGVAERLVLEITETARPRTIQDLVAWVDFVKSLGCRVALDDFGSGYSTIGVARDAAFDIIKIDGCYVRNRVAEDVSAPLLDLLVDLASAVASDIVVEGIESELDKAAAVASGAGWLQGYYLGIPALPGTRLAPSVFGEARL